MRILVYGAGPLGSLFAARLAEGGHQVSILARGQRLRDLREHGIVLEDTQAHVRTTTQVDVVEALAPDDAYDLVLVIMRKNRALEVLPILAANRHTPNVLFLMNNAAGPGVLMDALGAARVMVGFPNSAGYRDGEVVHYLSGTEQEPATVPIGEADGTARPRTREVAQALEQAPGFAVEIREDMDAWLKSHVALLMPSIAPALYMAGTDNYRMARTRDAVVLAVRAVREALRVLKASGVPVTPLKLKLFAWLPEPLLVLWAQRMLASPLMEVALSRHAGTARDEVRCLVDEFLVLARQTAVPTPSIDRLYAYLDPVTPPVPEGSAEIPLDWRGVWLWLGAIAGVVSAVALAVGLVRRRR